MNYINFYILIKEDLTVFTYSNGSPPIESKLELDDLDKQEINHIVSELENPDSWMHEHRIGDPAKPNAKIARDRIKKIGVKLSQALFTKDIKDHFNQVMRINGDKGVRIRLTVNHPNSRSYPWEVLHENNRYLALDTETPLTRFISEGTIRKVEVKTPLKIIIVGANPAVPGLSAVHVAREIKNIEDALKDEIEKKLVQLDKIRIGTVANVIDQLDKTQYHVFHFIGHGIFENSTGKLAFEAPDGKLDAVDHSRIGEILMNQKQMGLIILNACQGGATSTSGVLTGLAPELINMEIVPAVIAMRYSITNQTANQFSREFYPNLLKMPIDTNIQRVRQKISVLPESKPADFLAPVLFLNAPDGVIFTPKVIPPPSIDITKILEIYIEDPSQANDIKAWHNFLEFFRSMKNSFKEIDIEAEYIELTEIRNVLSRLRNRRDRHRRSGRETLADELEGTIQMNYEKAIKIIKDIQEKTPVD